MTTQSTLNVTGHSATDIPRVCQRSSAINSCYPSCPVVLFCLLFGEVSPFKVSHRKEDAHFSHGKSTGTGHLSYGPFSRPGSASRLAGTWTPSRSPTPASWDSRSASTGAGWSQESYCGWLRNPFRSTWTPGETMVGMSRGINIPGFLRWCETDFVHPQRGAGRNCLQVQRETTMPTIKEAP